MRSGASGWAAARGRVSSGDRPPRRASAGDMMQREGRQGTRAGHVGDLRPAASSSIACPHRGSRRPRRLGRGQLRPPGRAPSGGSRPRHRRRPRHRAAVMRPRRSAAVMRAPPPSHQTSTSGGLGLFWNFLSTVNKFHISSDFPGFLIQSTSQIRVRRPSCLNKQNRKIRIFSLTFFHTKVLIFIGQSSL